ncbi:flavohemoglobin expression-modulating QEGLA motif protein [Thalassomonas sp. M1454]|uniref:flavohemoglobin expression-modulating QEGLA motif protein n=1 Tax=Thalassomonas sp. M1454 TaxID=2594477 RepID=UPI00117BEFC4|nr:flavohemoglobin expression-modulating QEGLA motif protein [Thalassomonas sp. M1454]TRX56331.1 flavohemoglobin expression-modulating QEGLA motif protein [Thalassomonas sp. M1454]
MLTLSEKQCIALINKGECFHAEVENAAFIIKIDEYCPVICAAIHNGHNLRDDLQKAFLLSDDERFYEEDPYTYDLISSFPITICGNDSRFEYDLNRAKTLSTYFKTAWDKQVWQKPLTPKQRAVSHAKHQSFYNVLEALIAKIEKQFKNSIVFDIHSYNFKRIEQDTPTFNIGSAQIDIERWGSIANHFEKQLHKIELPNLNARAATNEVFQGRGYLITHVNAHFDNTLVLPVEVKKVFMNETNGELYPLVLEELQAGIKNAISETAAFFMRRYAKKKSVSKVDMLASSLAPEILAVDKKLYSLCRKIETLNFINPINIASERKKFLSSKTQKNPQFRYKQLNINPHQFREKLYKLAIDEIIDPDINHLYRHVIENYATKIDLLSSIGNDDFVYNSLKYYGEPDDNDIANAEFILRAPMLEGDAQEPIHNADYVVQYFTEIAKQWGLKCKIEKSARIVAKAMVNNEKGLLLVNKDALFSEKELKAFAYHELGIHMLTTINAKNQKLKVFSLGLVGNTHTQEGLAIFSEYCSGNLTLSRLKVLALRVMAVKFMLEHNDFTKTYQALIDNYQVSREQAFTLATRAYRGGGFTKDYLYLKGFRDIVALSKTHPLDNLLVGKTGLVDLPVVTEMIERGFIPRAQSLFPLTIEPKADTQIIDYLVSAIQ